LEEHDGGHPEDDHLHDELDDVPAVIERVVDEDHDRCGRAKDDPHHQRQCPERGPAPQRDMHPPLACARRRWWGAALGDDRAQHEKHNDEDSRAHDTRPL